jgi:hypothetical protein
MNPRKKESKKWSALPPELSKQIKTLFEESFSEYLIEKKLKVEGRIYPTEILMRVGVNYKGEIRYHNFEVSIDHDPKKQNTVPQIHVAVDALASLLLEFFDLEEEHEMPLVWQEYPFEKQKIWLQYTSANTDLEAEANKLLGIKEGEDLLQGVDELGLEIDPDMEDVEITEEDTQMPDDEEIDTSKPKIFRVATDNPDDSIKKKKKKEDMH